MDVEAEALAWKEEGLGWRGRLKVPRRSGSLNREGAEEGVRGASRPLTPRGQKAGTPVALEHVRLEKAGQRLREAPAGHGLPTGLTLLRRTALSLGNPVHLSLTTTLSLSEGPRHDKDG